MAYKFFRLLVFTLLILSVGCSVKRKSMTVSIPTNVDEKIIPLTIGTYTIGTSEGIYNADFNTETGEISGLELLAKVEQPTFLALSKNKEKVYAVSEMDNGKLSVFNRQKDGSYELIQEIATEGSTTVHVALNQDESLVSVANYRLGSITVYRLDADKLSRITSFKHTGSSVHFRQKVPHPHSTYFSQDERYIYVPDLGTDEIISYPIIDGMPTVGKVAIKMTPGDGPRHMAAHPTRNLWYVVGEISSVVWTLLPKADGTFEVIDKQNLLPEGIKGRSTAADIHISPDGEYLYTSNRGHQDGYHCISIFKILDSGKLKHQAYVTEGINQPRNFCFSPDGKFLLVANQYGNNIIVFDVKADGMLALTSHAIDISMPACLKF